VVRKKLDHREGAFSLGRFEMPVATAALVWVAFSFLWVIVTSQTLLPMLIAGGLILAGCLYFAYLMKFRRDVLDYEPGKADIF
jgi:hypothetical protein